MKQYAELDLSLIKISICVDDAELTMPMAQYFTRNCVYRHLIAVPLYAFSANNDQLRYRHYENRKDRCF